jgi:anti-sigma factor RsiW
MKHVRDAITAYHCGELGPERKAAVARHLASCPDCRMEADRVGALWTRLDTIGSAAKDEATVWPAVRARTLGRRSGAEDWFFGAGRLSRTCWAAGWVAVGLLASVLLPAGPNREAAAASDRTEAAWLFESSWLTDSSWSSEDDAVDLDDILLGADLGDEGNGP